MLVVRLLNRQRSSLIIGIIEISSIEQNRFVLKLNIKAPLETILNSLLIIYTSHVAPIHSIPTATGKRLTPTGTYFISAGPFSLETIMPSEKGPEEETNLLYVVKTDKTPFQEFENFRDYLTTKIKH